MVARSSFSSSAPSPAQRGSLFMIVLGLHALLLSLMMAHKTVLPPKVVESPLVVDLIEATPLPVSPAAAPAAEPPTPPPPHPKPKPTPKPKPRPKPTPTPAPNPPPPQLEATASSEPASDNAPAAPAEEAAPPDPAPAATGGSGGVEGGQGAAGSGLVQARFDADYLLNPAPPYPPMSRRMGEEGRVILRVRVSAAGKAEQVDIRTSSGSARLDESARKTVRAWRFVPAKRGGIPVDSWVLVPIHFRLEQ